MSLHEKFLFAGLIIGVCGVFTVARQRDQLRQQAIERGYAEWHTIPDTNQTQFKWKEEQ